MPRVKATKKQAEIAPAETLPASTTATNELAAANGNGSTNGADQNDALAKVSTIIKAGRAKKTTTTTTVGAAREGEGEGNAQKKPAARGKKKTEDIAQNGVQDVEVKPKGRAKKTPAPVLESEQEPPPTKVARGKKKTDNSAENGIQDVEAKPKGRAKKTPASALEAEEEPPKKAARGKKKTEDTAPNAVQEVKTKPKGRAKKTIAPAPAEEFDKEPLPITSKPTKPRAKKEKVPVSLVEAADVAPANARGRAKKETTPALDEAVALPKEVKSSSKQARGTKRLADADIADVLEEVEETETKPVAAAGARKKTKKDAPAATETKVRAKKTVKNEAVEEKEESVLPSTSTKRGQKKPSSKSKENEEAEIKPVRGRKRAAPVVSPEPNTGVEAVEEDSGSKSMLAEGEAPGCGGGAVLKSLHNVLNFCFPAAAKKKEKKVAEVSADSMGKALFTSPSKEFNLKISSWNVAGLRAWLKKDGLKFVHFEEPDIFCLQETKCSNDQLPEEMVRLTGYHPYWLCMPGGYAGVAIYSKIMPINVEYGIGNEEFDDVGRMITAEYEKFYLINVYVPNSGRKLVNLEPRMRWEVLFQAYVQKLDALKPVVICGDMNVSHLEIDLANPKANTRNAGFTKEEREKMSQLLELGYVDTFRHLYPDTKGAYTFWTYMANARARNVGWRLDYCIVSQRFVSRIVDQVFRSHCMGSDHCPITVFLNV